MVVARDDNVRFVSRAATTMVAIADLQGKGRFHLLSIATGRSWPIGLLLCFVFLSSALGQPGREIKEIPLARAEFNNGIYPKAIEFANAAFEKATNQDDNLQIEEALVIRAESEISQEKYNEAEKTLDRALLAVSRVDVNAELRAKVYIQFAWLFRAQRKFSEALNYSKKAVILAPKNQYILASHYLNIGRILFASGYDLSAIIWLEKAEVLVETEEISTVKLEILRFLSLAWWSKLNYQNALRYAQKCASLAENSPFKYKYRQSLFDLETILSESGQENNAIQLLKKGLSLSVASDNYFQACRFLTSLFLHSLDGGNIDIADGYLARLEQLDANKQFAFETFLGKAVISAYKNDQKRSDLFFQEAEKQKDYDEFPPLYWKIAIAERNKDWLRVIGLNQDLLGLTVKENFRNGLPKIYLTFAKAYFKLGEKQAAIENLEKCLSYIEEIRKSENSSLTLSLSENFHDVYRLLTQTRAENPKEALELSDFLKARLLKDRIDNSAIPKNSVIPTSLRKTLEELSLRYVDDQSLVGEIEKYEKQFSNAIPELNITKPDLSELDKIPDLGDTAIISYFFTLDKRLLAFVWEKETRLRTVYLSSSEDELETDAKNIQQKIKDRVFFKRDGKELFDKLLKPLSLSAKHLIIVPDKSLWKIPFQALSPDGEKYLIEEKVISYAPSVSILLDQLKVPKPKRKTFQAFANPVYDNRYLSHVNNEATNIASLFNSKPSLNSTTDDFRRLSDKPDILHFSMHAKVDNEWPLESFLGFRETGRNRGRLTVEDLLNSKLKKGSLVFLASCDTNNVMSGEGLVSLAWGMMAAGATTVISAQWEVSDELAGSFTKAFYKYYKQGVSPAEALQRASLEMIKNKSNNMHEPYYWADFTLNGDFR